MRVLDLGRSVRKVTIIKDDGIVVLHRGKKRRKKKKSSRELDPMERATRRMSDANLAAAASYSRDHRKSNRKKKDGWLRDMPENMDRASRKAWKKL